MFIDFIIHYSTYCYDLEGDWEIMGQTSHSREIYRCASSHCSYDIHTRSHDQASHDLQPIPHGLDTMH